MTVTNEEFQEALKEYPKDLPVAVAIKFNDHLSVYYDVKVEGIKSGDLRIVIITNPDLDEEYETLINGCEEIEENYC